MRFVYFTFIIALMASCQSAPSTDQKTANEEPAAASTQTSTEKAPQAPNYGDQYVFDQTVADKMSVEETKKEIMRIHDEVMPMMSTLNRNSRALKQHLEANPELPAGRATQARNAITTIASADDRMMNWMEQFHKGDEMVSKMGDVQKKTFYKSEYMNVISIANLVKLAMKESTETVQSLKIK